MKLKDIAVNSVFVTLIGLTSVNLVSMGFTKVNIYNSYSAPINYAVDSSPQEAITQLTQVKEWMKSNKLTKGNTCVFVTSNPYCELNNFYEQRLNVSIAELETAIKTNDSIAMSNLSLKLNERFMAKGSKENEYVRMPNNLNLYMRYGSLLTLGWYIDALTWVVLFIGLIVLSSLTK